MNDTLDVECFICDGKHNAIYTKVTKNTVVHLVTLQQTTLKTSMLNYGKDV